MPRLPIPEYQQSVLPQSTGPTPQASGARFESTAPGLAQAGQVVTDFAAKFQEEQNVTATNEAYATKFSPVHRQLYGAYYALQGKDALEQLPEYEKQMQENRAQVRDGLTNERQRKMFDEISRRRIESELDAMARHAERENRVWRAQTHEATLLNLSSQAADKYNDERAFAGALQSGLTEIDRYTTAIGASPEVTRAQGERFVSHAWEQRIERYSLADPKAALELYNAHHTEISPERRPILEKHLKSSVMPVEAKEIAQSVLGAVEPGSSKDIRANLGELVANATAQAEKLRPGDLVFRSTVEQEVKGRLATITQAQEGIERQATEIALKVAIEKKPTTPEALQRDPDARRAWQIMSPQSQLGVLGVIRHNAHEAENGGATMKTNATVFADLWDRVSLPEGDPRKIRSANEVSPYLARGLNITSFNFLVKRLDEHRTESGQRLDSTRNSFLQAVKPQFDQSTLLKVDEKGGEDFYKFRTFALEREAQAVKDGKDPYTLYNPGSPDYLGKQMAPFMRSVQEKIRGLAETLQPPKPLPPDQQRKAGESIDDYRKRLGLK